MERRGGGIFKKSPNDATTAGLCKTPSSPEAHDASFEAACVPPKPDPWMYRLGEGPGLIHPDRTRPIHSPGQPRRDAGVSNFCSPGDDKNGGLGVQKKQKLLLVLQQHQPRMLPHAG
jgi:hypothetical protein